MRLRNSDAGYGMVNKTLHWVTATALLVQVVIGYSLDDDHGRGRGRGRGRGSGRGRGGGEDDFDSGLLTAHVVLGSTVLALAVVRVAWRLTTPLPPWSDRLGGFDRRLENLLERMLILLLFVIPLSGLALVTELADDDVLLALHVAGHITLYLTVAVHVALAVRRRTLHRMLAP